jgi:predicted peptidase
VWLVVLMACSGGGSTAEVGCPKNLIPQTGTQTLYVSGSTCSPLGFAAYLPEKYDTQDAWPLIVFFHGWGEKGNGGASSLSLLLRQGLPKAVQNNSWDPLHRFVVLSPQYDLGDLSNPEVFKQFIGFAKTQFKIDLKRIYLTGISLGGEPLYLYLSTTNGADIAAAVPISAGTDRSALDTQNNPRRLQCAYKDVPLWMFHGDLDELVLPQKSLDMYNKINQCKPTPFVPPLYTEYIGVGHDAWTRTYDSSGMHSVSKTGRDPFSRSIYDWMLGHSRP